MLNQTSEYNASLPKCFKWRIITSKKMFELKAAAQTSNNLYVLTM